MKDLPQNKQKAIVALIESGTIRDAAVKAGLSEPTLFRYLQDGDFQAAYREARRETVRKAIGTLQRAADEAVKTLRDVMKDKEAPASARVSAARTVIETSLKAVELEDLAARVEKLEKAIQEQKQTNL